MGMNGRQTPRIAMFLSSMFDAFLAMSVEGDEVSKAGFH